MLGQPVACKFAHYRFATRAVQPFAMYHQHAAQVALYRLMHETLQQLAGCIGLIAVQVEAVIYRPGSAPQLAQGHARQAVAQVFIRRIFSREIGKCVGNRGPPSSGTDRRLAGCGLRCDAVLFGDRLHGTDGRTEQRGIVGA